MRKALTALAFTGIILGSSTTSAFASDVAAPQTHVVTQASTTTDQQQSDKTGLWGLLGLLGLAGLIKRRTHADTYADADARR